MKTLMLLRHAKSDWGAAADDFARPLAKRGRAAAKKMGEWMRRHDIVPDHVISSPAARARETAQSLSELLPLDASRLFYEERLYLADVDALLDVLRDCPTMAKSVMLIGHNPGLEQLLTHLCGEDVPSSASGKLLPTASLAQIALPDNWQGLKSGSGRLIAVTRPKEL